MNLLIAVILIGAAVAGGVYWLRNNDGPLAEAVRNWLKVKENETAQTVDSVSIRVDAGLLKKGDLIALARGGLYKVTIILQERELAVQRAQAAVDQAKEDKELALREEKDELHPAFNAACRHYDHALTRLASATASRDQIKLLIANMEEKVDAQHDQKDSMEDEAAELVAASTVREIETRINEAEAGLSKQDDGTRDFQKARELADKLQAHATASEHAAGGLTQREREVKALEALHTRVKNTNANEEWKRMKEAASQA